MAGGFQLLDSILPEIQDYYEFGKEVVPFDDEQDCVEKLRYYLAHPEERLEIVHAAQQRTLKEHTYANRVVSIFNIIDSKPRKPTIPNPLQSSKHRILMVTHNLYGEGHWGGVEVYQDWIRSSLSDEYEFWFYSPVPETQAKVCTLRNSKLEIVEYIEFDAVNENTILSCDQRELAFSKLILEHEIVAVHFQHLLDHVPSLPLIAKALGVPTMISLHDYYSLCNKFTLIDSTGRYCGVENQSESGCDICLRKSHQANSGSQTIRRSFYRRVLENITVLHANTQGVIERYQSVYESLKQHDGIEVMGVPIRGGVSKQAQKPKATNRLQVAVVGNFTLFKGADILIPVFQDLAAAQIDFHIIGRVDSEYEEAINNGNSKNVTVHGAYEPNDLQAILQNMSVSLHLSIWPETYCLTLSEAWRARLIPIVSDIGALGERVQDGENGFKFPLNNIGKLVDSLNYLASSQDNIDRMREKLDFEEVVFEADHDKFLRSVYSKLCAEVVLSGVAHNTQSISLKDCGLLLNSPIWLRKSIGPVQAIEATNEIPQPMIFELIPITEDPFAKLDLHEFQLANPDVSHAIERSEFLDASHYFREVGLDKVRNGMQKIHSSLPIFNEKEYLKNHPDIQTLIETGRFDDGFSHYLKEGVFELLNGTRSVNGISTLGIFDHENNDSNSSFDSLNYLKANPDVIRAIENGTFSSALEHFTKYGSDEVRKGDRKLHLSLAVFDEQDYVSRNQNVRTAVHDGLFENVFQHYLQYGYIELLEGKR